MGQKINPTLYRLGSNLEWKSSYKAHNKNEESSYVIQDLHIRKFIYQYFKKCEFMLCDIKIRRTPITIGFLISYYKLPNRLSFPVEDKEDFTHAIESYSKNLTESLRAFLPNDSIVKVWLRRNNKSPYAFYKDKHLFRRFGLIMSSLRRFKKDPHFNDLNNLMLTVVSHRYSAQILADSVARILPQTKRQSAFLNLLRKMFTLFVDSNLSKLKGLKLLVRGRLNGRPRAKTTLIQVGKMPNQTLSSVIYHAQSTSYTSDGTFGITVWICVK